jgi:signal transduction histidine kinase/ligand-binding sensor domain-containing protein
VVFPLVSLLLAPLGLAALNPAIPLHELVHTSWTRAEGIPAQPVLAAAVGPDGFLWVTTPQGVLRFDGLRFTPWRPPEGHGPAGAVTFLAPAQRGIWLGTAAGVTYASQGQIRDFPDLNRQIGGTIVQIAEDPDVGLWILAENQTGSALAILVDGKLRVFRQADGLPGNQLRAIALEGAGRLRLATTGGLCTWAPGRQAACDPAFSGAAVAVAVSADGALTAGDSSGRLWRREREGASWQRTALGDVTLMRSLMLSDSRGTVWAGTASGLLRFANGRVEKLTRSDGLSGSLIYSLAEDAEGDIWVATNGGLDRLHDPRVRHMTSADGLVSDSVPNVLATSDGAVWAGGFGTGLNRIANGTVRVYGKADGVPGSGVDSLFEDSRRRLWLFSGRGMAYFDRGRFVASERAPGAVEGYGIGEDVSGTIWVTDIRQGLLRDGRFPTGILPPAAQWMRVLGAPDGTLWFGSHQGHVAALGNGTLSEYPRFPGPVRALYRDRSGAVWVGAGTALGRFRHSRWTRWDGPDKLADSGIQGIVEDDLGSLWVVTGTSALRIRKAELDAVPDGSPRPVPVTAYGAADGLLLSTRIGATSPRVAKSSDGRIWICEEASLGILDPATLRPDPVAPPVEIERIALDGKPLADRAPLSFRGRELHIAYTGVSLLAPERVRFRYRLRPSGERWVDAGTTRDVTYVDLPPRRYRFEVAACNLDNVCNEAGAGLDFLVEPYFYQTTWFRAVCAAALGFAIWGAWQMRLRTLVQRFQLVAQERARVTREIHDSLLQGFAGVVYQLDAAARQFDTAPSESRKKLERALDLADQALREAREVLSTMRLTALEDRTLPEALARICRPVAEDSGVAFSLKTKGGVEPLPYEAQAALFLIGREAVTNAAKHAHSSHIAVLVAYSSKEVRLSVQDDGSGFDPSAVGEPSGHFGLRGMRERAKHAGVDFRLESAPGKGTRVEAAVSRHG